MKTFKQIDEVWEAYCKMTDVEVGQRIAISYNPSEITEHRVEIFCNGKSISISTEEARLLAEKLYYLTFDEEIANDTTCRSPEGKIEVVERDNGTEWWYLDGVRHREDGPAIEKLNGEKHWMRHGKFHREDGPAREWANGDKEWWIDGKQMTEEEWKERTGK